MNNLITNIFIAIMLVTFIVGYDIAHTPTVDANDNLTEIYNVPVASPSPLETTYNIKDDTIYVSTPTPLSVNKNVPDNEIEQYIYDVFGHYYDLAMLLLTGQGAGTCAENRTLNPNAVNYNWTDIEGVWSSRDRGIFQINDAFHPLSDADAFDYKKNIDYSYRMFVNDGHSFRRWTCGRYYGI